MDIRASFIADRQPAELVQPGKGPLRHPAGASQALLRFAAFAGQARLDVPPPQGRTVGGRVIRLIGMELLRSAAGPSALAPDRRHGVDHRLQGGRSLTFAAVRPAVSGMPLRSTSTWCLLPGLPRSVGFFPVAWPPLLPGRMHCPDWRGRNLGHQPGASGSAARPPGAARRLRPASRATGASRSCPSHSPSPGAAIPTGCPSSTQRGYRSAPPDPRSEAGHPSAGAARAG